VTEEVEPFEMVEYYDVVVVEVVEWVQHHRMVVDAKIYIVEVVVVVDFQSVAEFVVEHSDTAADSLVDALGQVLPSNYLAVHKMADSVVDSTDNIHHVVAFAVVAAVVVVVAEVERPLKSAIDVMMERQYFLVDVAVTVQLK